MARNHRPRNFRKRLTISLKNRQRQELHRIADDQERSLAFVVRDAVDSYIQTHTAENKGDRRTASAT